MFSLFGGFVFVFSVVSVFGLVGLEIVFELLGDVFEVVYVVGIDGFFLFGFFVLVVC